MGRFLHSRFGAPSGVLLAGLVLIPIALLMGGASGIDQATVWIVYGLFAISVDLMWGYCGMLSFGQATFFGLGAYAYSWLTTDTLDLNMGAAGTIIGPLAAIVLAGLLALLLGYFLFYGKVKGDLFVVVTLALSFLMQCLGQGWSKAFGGFTGIPGVPGIVGMEGAWAGFILVLVITVLVTFAVRALLRTPFGLGVDGVRDNEERLAFLGTKTEQTKLVVFVVASAIAGLAGALYASQANFVSSDLLGTLLSTEAVVWVAVGGRKTLVGAFVGALVVRGVGYWLSDIAVNWWTIFLGMLFVIVVLGGSTGLAGLGKWAWERGARRVAGDR